MARPPRRTKPKDSGRRPRKKVSILNQEKVDYIDWKDVNLLRRFVSDRAKIRARRVTANNTQQQRAVAMAIKNAREMALLPYTSRVTTHRGPRSQGGDERGGPSDRVPSTEELTDLLDIAGAEGAEGVEVTVDALAGGEETE